MSRHHATTEADSARPRLFHRLVGALKRNPIKSIVALELALITGYYMTRKEEQDTKKKVLVIPFHRMKIVEKKKTDIRSLFRNQLESSAGGSGNDDAPIEMQVDELVELIHNAASDPNIVALYGIFGHGFGFSTGGWAHIEEVRNALQVFRESHRVHREPNLQHEPLLKRHSNGTPKPLYAYADTFAHPAGLGTSEYYLATAFTHIQLQNQGDLNLFGPHSTNTFLKDALHKYGVKIHVFKHGMYKNFPNKFTERSFTKEHKENVSNILLQINQHVCTGIYASRRLQGFEFSNFWTMVHNAGTFPGSVAEQIGFVDYLPRLDPLDQLVLSNKSEKEKKEMKQKWGKETDMDHFTAEEAISITQYAKKVSKKKAQESKDWTIHKNLKEQAQKRPALKTFMSAMGYQAPRFNIAESKFSERKATGVNEKIAVINIGGAITDATARKTEKMLRKLKKSKDVKCVILRVDSPGGAITACETIHQEIRDLPQKVIVSFGNVSASGGYYISAGADRIYASPTTITGSIGVFMLKIDLRGLAEQYGVKFDSISTSELSGSFDPFYPINRRMKDNFSNFADRTYLHFKSLVGTGRGMDMDLVESVAQGRVWTGEQAKELGLVDELGGLHRAIAYAQRNYTESGQATVVAWPPQPTVWDMLMKRRKDKDLDDDDMQIPSLLHMLFFATEDKPRFRDLLARNEYALGSSSFPLSMSGMMLTADENSAISCLLQNNNVPDDITADFPPSFWQ